MLLVIGLVTLCIVFIAANTASMAVRERSGEIGVLKAIGFSRRLIFGNVLAEAAGLSFVAGIGDVLVTIGMARSLRAFAAWEMLGPLGPLGSFVVTAPVIVQSIFPSLFVGPPL